MPPKSQSTIRRFQLGGELRRLREQAALTMEDVEQLDGINQTTLSRVEKGNGSLKRASDLERLLKRYQVTDPEDKEFLLELHRNALAKGWWSPFRSYMPSGMMTFVQLEGGAHTIRAWQPNIIHGLLQTEDYARALFEQHRAVDDTTLEFQEKHVELRRTRQDIITRADSPTRLSVIQDEASLRHIYAGTMRAQFDRIIELSSLPNVEVQILPFCKGGTVGGAGDFTLLDFEEGVLDPVVQADTVMGTSTMTDKRSEVQRFTRRFDSLRATALGPAETPDFLHDLARKM
ncbi:helix-turn-helix domain-containing protein [Streptantibioticus parmotrematis]|uniref:helix-turn-helix domain-containing protein n=1 Tax=Streptantibioticus parmotrematis TaxID=2873249 RepID=UPI0027E194BB|nr:helix-turn-helix transcriptional regulator [Streptantibioticus parmotrematis]